MNSKTRISLAGLLILALVAATPARAALGLVIAPSAITNDYSGLIVFQITGLNSNGASVRLDKFADFNRNGVIDPEDLLVDSFTVTDGVLPTIGGVRNSNVPGDEDATADQNIEAILYYPGLDRTLSRFAGSYVYRATSGTASTTKPFVVTQKVLPQGVMGRLTSAQSGLPLTNTFVVLIQPDTSGGVGTVTDTNGYYTLYAPPGNYAVVLIKAGFVADQNAGAVTVPDGEFTTRNLTGPVGTISITGRVTDASSGKPVPGILVRAESTANLFAVGFADTNGYYRLSITPGIWKVKGPSDVGAARAGLLVPRNALETNLVANTTANFALPRANALIYGLVYDGMGIPQTGLGVFAEGGAFSTEGAVDQSGFYYLGVTGGSWDVNFDGSDLLAHQLVGSGTNVNLNAGEAVPVVFTFQHYTAHLTGTVIDELGVPVAGLRLQANPQAGGSGVNSQPTDASGNFSVGVLGGDWSLQAEGGDAAALGFVFPNRFFTVTDGVDITGITYLLRRTNATISGSVRDAANHPVPDISVFASATIDGTNYNVGDVSTDASGNFVLQVITGNWGVNLDCNDATARGFDCPGGINAPSGGRADFVLTATPVSSSDATSYLVAKGQAFRQTGATPVAKSPAAGFSAGVNTASSPAESFVSAASLTLPNNVVRNLASETDSFEFRQSPASVAALDAAFPNGVYIYHLETVHNGVLDLPLVLAGNIYPNTPTLLNFPATQVINPSNDFTVSWTAFAGGTAADFINFKLRDSNDQKVFDTGSMAVNPNSLRGTATSTILPANTLAPNQTYTGRLLFAKAILTDTTSYPGAQGLAAYFKETEFTFKTGSGLLGFGVATKELPNRQVGLAYAAQLEAVSGVAPFTWAIAAGQLPNGLALLPTGVIGGTPDTAGSFSFTVRVTNAAQKTATKVLTIQIHPTPPGFPIATAPGNEVAFSLASDGSNFLVGLQGDEFDKHNIVAQRVAADGTLLGGKIRTGRTGGAPFAAFDGVNYLLVWQDDANSPNDDIYGQIISPGGALLGGPFVISSAAGEQRLDGFNPVVFDGTNYFVVWRDGRTSNGPDHGPWSVYGQFISPNGSLVGSEIQISTGPGKEASLGFGGGRFLVAWNEDSNDTDINGQFLDRSGALLGANFVIDANGFPSDNPVGVTYDGTRFLVTFHDEVVPGNWDLFARFVTFPNTVAASRVTISAGAKDAHFPQAVFTGTNYLILWIDDLSARAANAPAPKVVGRFFDLSGSPATAEFTLVSSPSPRTPLGGAALVGGRFFFLNSWVNFDTNTTGRFEIQDGDVYGQFITPGPPSVATPPLSQTAVVGSNVLFSVEAVGLGPLHYQWQFNNVNLAGATNSTLLRSNAQPAVAGSYRVVITNALGSVASASATLTLLVPPGITTQPVGTTVAAGASVTFTVGASGTGPLTFQWRLNGVNIPGATGASFSITNAQPGDSGTYSVVVGNGAGAVTSGGAALIVSAPALPFGDNFAARVSTNSVSGTGIGSNAGATLEPGEPQHAHKNGGHSVWYSWIAPGDGTVTFTTRGSGFDTLLAVYNGTTISNLVEVANDDDRGGFSTSLVQFNAATGVEYNIAIDGLSGAVGNIVLSWNFIAGPQNLPVIITQPQGVATTVGGTAAFLVTDDGQFPLTYQWFFNGAAILGETNAQVALGNLQAASVGSYFVRLSNGTRSVDSLPAALELTALPATPTQDKLEDVLATAGQSSRLLKGGPKSSFASVAAGTVNAQLLDNYGATTQAGEPNHGGVPGGASRWQVIVPDTDGLLEVDTLGSDIDTTLAVYTGTNILSLRLITQDDNGAPDHVRSLVRFRCTGGVTYLVAVDGVRGAQGHIQLNSRLALQPSINGGVTDQFAGRGEAFSFHATVPGAGPYGYQWYFNGAAIEGATGATYTIDEVEAADSGSYRVAVTNGYDSFESGPVALGLFRAAPTFTLQPTNRIALAGATVQLAAAARGDLPPRYQWTLKGKAIRGATNATFTLPNVAVKASGDYRVIAANAFGAVTSSVANVSVFIPVSIKTPPKSLTVLTGKKAAFKVTVAGTKPFAYQWRLNGLNLPGATNAAYLIPAVQPSQAGSYTVVVSNPAGSLTSAAAVLTVSAAKTLAAPSAHLAGRVENEIPAASVLHARRAPDGTIQLHITGPRGQSHAVEASTDLIEWFRIGVITNGSGAVEFNDPEAAGRPHRFYRLVAP